MRIIESTKESVLPEVQEPIDLIELLNVFQEEHRNVFMISLEDTVFVYRSLGRSEYKKLIQNDELIDLEKQDVICQVCTLYPSNYDFDQCSAGIPSVLSRKIIENSFLDSIESRNTVRDYYRNEMFDLENQIACIINEAFPMFDIEEIESWDTEKTMKYLSRAEWKLQNLRGIPFVDSQGASESFYPLPRQEEVEVEPEPKQVAKEEEGSEKTRRGQDKVKMTPEKIAEMKELQKKFPEINFFGDTILNEGVEGMVDSVDNLAPALRPGFY